jgi:predicted metalloprotease
VVRYEQGQSRRHIEDRRGMGTGAKIGAGIGIPGLLIYLLVTFLGGGGGGLGDVIEQLPQAQAPVQERDPDAPDPQAQMVDYMAFVMNDSQATWQEIFAASDLEYRDTTLVLYEQGTNTGCGYGSAAVGPFYCPADEKVYLDLSFFQQLSQRFGATGDFAQAYVIAHEVGHHVQQVLGISSEVRSLQQQDPASENDLSIALELQADCFAGVWARSAYDALEPGDVNEALEAASAVGDDAIQRQAQGRVTPETWTHGSSEQRMEWFQRGLETGDPSRCDTFGS